MDLGLWAFLLEIMASQAAKKFYNSKQWKNCKATFIAYRISVDGGLCQECHDAPGYIVHHEIKLNEDNINNPKISLNHDYLKYVCKSCHDKYEGHGVRGTHKKQDKQSITFDEFGQPVSMRDIDSPHYREELYGSKDRWGALI